MCLSKLKWDRESNDDSHNYKKKDDNGVTYVTYAHRTQTFWTQPHAQKHGGRTTKKRNEEKK